MISSSSTSISSFSITFGTPNPSSSVICLNSSRSLISSSVCLIGSINSVAYIVGSSDLILHPTVIVFLVELKSSLVKASKKILKGRLLLRVSAQGPEQPPTFTVTSTESGSAPFSMTFCLNTSPILSVAMVSTSWVQVPHKSKVATDFTMVVTGTSS